MSSGSERDRPCGLLRQGNKVVGNVSMPEATEIFIKEFNHCYGQLRLEVSEQPTIRAIPNATHTRFDCLCGSGTSGTPGTQKKTDFVSIYGVLSTEIFVTSPTNGPS